MKRLHQYLSKHNRYRKRCKNSKDSQPKTWKTQYLVFRSYQRISPLFLRKTGWKTQKDRKKSCIALLTIVIRLYKNLWLKSKSLFKDQTRITLELTLEKTCCRQKWTFEQFMQSSVLADMKLTKRGLFREKFQNYRRQKKRGRSSCKLQSKQICSRRNEAKSDGNLQKKPAVPKFFLESNCKRFRQNATRENFNLKPET